jgi:hypothetical protein
MKKEILLSFEDLGYLIENPELHICSRSFKSLVHYIDGYMNGKNGIEFEFWVNYRRIISKRLSKKSKLSSNTAWWMHLLKLYPDDEDAIVELLRIFQKGRIAFLKG